MCINVLLLCILSLLDKSTIVSLVCCPATRFYVIGFSNTGLTWLDQDKGGRPGGPDLYLIDHCGCPRVHRLVCRFQGREATEMAYHFYLIHVFIRMPDHVNDTSQNENKSRLITVTSSMFSLVFAIWWQGFVVDTQFACHLLWKFWQSYFTSSIDLTSSSVNGSSAISASTAASTSSETYTYNHMRTTS